MVAQHWDVSSEFRGEHGKWARGGAAVHRLAGEAEKAAEGKLQQGHRVKYKSGSLGTVHHIDDKGTPHIVWDKGRGKPVRTPAHHLTRIEGEQKKAAAEEKAVREVTSKPYKPPRQAGSRGGVPAPTAGGLSPELRAQMERIQAEQKAKMEAENKARLPQGNVTERKDILTTPESQAYLAKLRGGGVQAKSINDMTRDELTLARSQGKISAAEYAKEIARRTGSLRGIR